MALAIDASSPATATQSNGAGAAALASASFTPPASSLLVVLWSADSATATNPSTPTITDSLGAPLTYTLRQWASRVDTSPNQVEGQVAIWTAPVTTSAAMTVTVTNQTNVGGTANDAALRILVMTDTTQPTVGVSGKSNAITGSSATSTYTATQTGSWGFLVVNDWSATGTMTAGTGMTVISAASFAGLISYGFGRRTTADGVNGSGTTVAMTLAASSTAYHWGYVEILGAAGAATPIPTLVMARTAY